MVSKEKASKSKFSNMHASPKKMLPKQFQKGAAEVSLYPRLH